eukprot:1914474-Pyramimonas_sp.AAC.1
MQEGDAELTSMMGQASTRYVAIGEHASCAGGSTAGFPTALDVRADATAYGWTPATATRYGFASSVRAAVRPSRAPTQQVASGARA